LGEKRIVKDNESSITISSVRLFYKMDFGKISMEKKEFEINSRSEILDKKSTIKKN